METYVIRFGMSTIPGDPTSYIILHPRNTGSGTASGLAYLPGEFSELRMLSPEFLYFRVKSLDKTKVAITISGVSDI